MAADVEKGRMMPLCVGLSSSVPQRSFVCRFCKSAGKNETLYLDPLTWREPKFSSDEAARYSLHDRLSGGAAAKLNARVMKDRTNPVFRHPKKPCRCQTAASRGESLRRSTRQYRRHPLQAHQANMFS